MGSDFSCLSAGKPSKAPLGKPLDIGDVAPAFELKDKDGNLIKLSNYAGRRVIISFFQIAA